MIKLSIEQKAAIESKCKNILLIAGAGTGKTTVLTLKIQSILTSKINPSEILAITFTRKAANEMKARIKNDDIDVYTFDALCYKHIKDLYKIRIIEDNIPFYKNEVLSFHLYDANLRVGRKPQRYDEYVSYKLKNEVFDFNDIEYHFLNNIKRLNIKYKYILVDEFQDTNRLQFLIIKKLTNIHTNLFVVGDPDQSIYSFRGSYEHIFKDFIKEYKPQILKLSYNYRSNRNIIEVANTLISNNIKRIDKELISFKKGMELIEYYSFQTEDEEVEFVIKQFQNMDNSGNKSIAILYRNHFQSYELKRKLIENSIKVSILSIHEAKGLEYDVVFVIGLNKGVFPSVINNEISSVEEERRLLFVAITRSKSKLYITSSNKPSLFIREIGLNHRR